MSKATVTNKYKLQQSDNEPVAKLDNKKQKSTKKQLKYEDNNEEDVNIGADILSNQQDSKLEILNKKTVVRKKKLSKFEMYKEEQNDTFDKLKILLDVKKNGTFTSEKVKRESEELTTVYLQKIKKFYDTSLVRSIKGEDIKACMAIIKKIFKHHGYELATKEYQDGEERGIKYVMVKFDEE